TTSAAQIASRITDHATDPTRPTVLFQPFANSSTTTTTAGATVTYSVSDQHIALTATVSSGGGTVNEGTATFSLMRGPTAIGSPATATVTAGTANTSLAVPGGTPGGVYTIQAVYN